MDAGAQQNAPDTDANTSSAGTKENVGASNKSADIDKEKAPEKLKTQATPEQPAPKQTMWAMLEQAVPQPAPSPARTTPSLAKTTAPLKMPTPAPPKAMPTPPPEVAKTRTTKTTKVTKDKDVAAPSSIAQTLHTSKGAAQISSLVNLELEGHAPLRTKSGNSLDSLK
jgi:hypothetical protein